MNELFVRLEQVSIGKAVIIGVVLAGLYWMMSDDGSSIEAMIQSSQSQIQTTRKSIEEEEEKVQLTQRYKLTVASLGNELQVLSDYIPKDLRASDLMKTVSSEAKAAGLDIVKVSEGGVDQRLNGESDLYESFSVNVELAGTFPQHVLFLSFLTRLKSIVTIDNFQLTTQQKTSEDGSSSPSVKFNVELVGYRYKGSQTGATQ